MKLIEVTYTVTVPDDFPEGLCDQARVQYGFSLEKNRRRMEAVTLGLRHFHPALRVAQLDVAVSHCVEYDKGATARRITEVKDAAAKRKTRAG